MTYWFIRLLFAGMVVLLAYMYLGIYMVPVWAYSMLIH